MTIRIWAETGGDTGRLELYTQQDDIKVGHIDWDQWEYDGYEPDYILRVLEEYGDIMPKNTRQELLGLLQPDEEAFKEKGWTK